MRQVEAAVEEGAFGEFTGARRSRTADAEYLYELLQEYRVAVAVEFGEIFARIG